MKKKYFWKTILAILIVLNFITGCNAKKDFSVSSNKDTLNYFYHADPSNFDYLVDFHMTNSTQFENLVEGLLESDPQGNLRGAIAKSWKVSKDNLTYTYQVRKGIKWIQADGSEYDEVKPSDWVTGLKHAADSKSQMLFIVQNSIKGLDDYVKGIVKNFSHVGIKADDKKGTVTYTLNAPESYWNSKLSQSILYPLNAKFLKAKGKKFGEVTPEGILYNGPYILTEFTSKSVIRMKANDAYYDKKNVPIKKINLTFDSDKDPSLQYRGFAKGEFSAAILKPADASYKKIYQKNKNKICYMYENFGTYYGMFNFNRQSYKYTIKNKNKDSTHKAIMNLNFRKAILFSLNLEKINSQTYGEQAGPLSVRHSLVPPNFVSVEKESYGYILQKKMNELNFDWQSVDFTKDGNNTSYNPKLAKKCFERAKTELSAQGVQFPIHLDTVEEENVTKLNDSKSMKQSIEETLGQENVVYDIHKISKNKMISVTYLAETAKDKDYDFAFYGGWNPDYCDLNSYLEMYSSSIGSELSTVGLSAPDQPIYTDVDKDIVKTIGLDKYDELLAKANKIKQIDKQADRVKAFSKAEAYLLNNVYIIPIRKEVIPCMLKIKPFSWSNSSVGIGAFVNLRYPRWKYVKLQNDIVTVKQYKKAQKASDKKITMAKILDEKK
ncbi:MAG: ABC transporter substrate-binding protein [Streptococcaceae bacterium]|nr:ABC transporter substrate-binding protein [Streptococcaceae bacterium]